MLFVGKMCDFGQSYKKKGKRQRTTCGMGECGAGLPDPPRPQLLPLVQPPVVPRVLAWRARGRLLSHRTQPVRLRVLAHLRPDRCRQLKQAASLRPLRCEVGILQRNMTNFDRRNELPASATLDPLGPIALIETLLRRPALDLDASAGVSGVQLADFAMNLTEQEGGVASTT